MEKENNILNDSYKKVWKEIKSKIHSAQIKAALSVNSQLINMYWSLGKSITEQQAKYKWGNSFIDKLSKDLSNEFSDMKGFSKRNLELTRQFYRAYSNNEFAKQLASQIPWFHNITIIQKVKNEDERLWYIKQAIENGWSRNVLSLNIESKLYTRQGKNEPRKVTNFSRLLPKSQSDLAENTLKDPYIFDFLSIGKDAHEREIERELTNHIQNFLLELGKGFAFLGRQVPIQVGEEEFFLDMVFYHIKLRCFVVIELKAGKFRPADLGQLNFYLTAVNKQMKAAEDNPTIGMLLCKDKDRIVAEYALEEIKHPIGISEYQIIESLPKKLVTSLPSIEELEEELNKE